MTHPRRATAAALLAVLAAPALVAAAPVPAEKSALAAVPASAPLVLYVRGVERTKERLTAMLDGLAVQVVAREGTVTTDDCARWVKQAIVHELGTDPP